MANVTYKGRVYRLLWKGTTKYGERAHLEFTDGTKNFWCDASLVSGASEASSSNSSSSGYKKGSHRGKQCFCAECGEKYYQGKVCRETGGQCVPEWE